jgi:polyphosphate glucokinase
MIVLGIDIGGSGIKGAAVDLSTGTLAADRFRIETPKPADPERVTRVVAEVAAKFDLTGPVGVTFPGVVTHGIVRTAANVDKSWIGVNAAVMFREAIGRPVYVLNDADAAGVAELSFGSGRGQTGLTVLLTFGTGIGSALFVNKALVPNTEFGHLLLRNGTVAEHWAAESAREKENLSWSGWALRVQDYLRLLEDLVWPDLYIVGGGASKKAEKFLPLLEIRTPIVPATLLNHAGIVGAAMAASAYR